MIVYLDTSVLVAALTRETHSARVEAWLGDRQGEQLAISDWVVTEFSAALSMKLRTNQIDGTQRATALALFSQFAAQNAVVLTVERGHFQTAASFSDEYRRSLRAADALHLAVCFGHGATLCTLDRRLADAGPALGVTTLLV